MNSNSNQKDAFEQQTVSIFSLFAMGAAMMLFSRLRYENSLSYMLAPGEMLASFLLGFLNALIDYRFFILPELKSFSEIDWKKIRNISYWKFIVTIFLYMGLYQCIMLPMEGLGIIEFVFAFLLLACMFLGLNFRNFVVHPKMLIVWQFCAVAFKVLFLFLPQNLYTTFFDGNSFGRNLFLIFILLIGFFAIKRKANIINENKAESFFKKTGSTVRKIFAFVVSLITKLINFLLSIACNPYIVIIIAAVLIILIPTAGVIFAENLRESALGFFELFLRGALSTGRYRIYPNPMYCVFQIVTILIYVRYLFEIYQPEKTNSVCQVQK